MIGGTEVESPPQTSTLKLNVFIPSRLTHKNFRIGLIYNINIKEGFD